MKGNAHFLMGYLAANIPDSRITIFQSNQNDQFVVLVPGEGVAHTINFNRDALKRMSSNDLVERIETAGLFEIIGNAVFALDITFGTDFDIHVRRRVIGAPSMA